MSDIKIQKSYELAKEKYAEIGIDTDKVLENLSEIPISIHCWQGDDVGGFEQPAAELSGGGIQATGNYPGKARNIEELRKDFEKALSLIPGDHRINLHAIYLDNGGKFVDRDKIDIEHFQSWIDWARENNLGIDFNPTFFSHPKAADGFTLSHNDKQIRDFWIEHGKRCRKIAEQMGKQLGTPSVVNFWMPDGYKDIPADKLSPRIRMKESLDEIFSEKLDKNCELDAVESKLFGIGAESFTVGSHEFYLGYAAKNQILLCLDSGHYHPTEMISDKISAVLNFIDELLLHVSRPVRWDSDHVILFSDEIKAIADQIVNNNLTDRVHIGLDFFDASINRIAAWTIGTRNMIKALLLALLKPQRKLKEFEDKGDYTSRLAIMEDLRTMPFGDVWNYYCMKKGVPADGKWMPIINTYENEVLSKRQ